MSLAVEGPQPFFDDVVDHMAAVCSAPIAIVVLTNVPRQWVSGVDQGKGGEVDPSTTFDALRLMGDENRVVNDTATQPDFPTDSVDARRSQIRAYIAERMVHAEEVVGHIYLADRAPREWSDADIAYMGRLSRLMVAQAEARSMIAERDRRIELERELAAADGLYRTVVEHMTEGVVLLSPDGVIEAANEVACSVLGVSLEELKGTMPTDPRWRPVKEDGTPLKPEENPVVRALATHLPQLGVLAGIDREDGERRWLEINVVPVFGRADSGAEADAETVRVATTFRDVTEKYRQERLLIEAREAAEREAESKQQFLSSMSHEIRTPLNGVVGLAQALKMTSLDAEQLDLVETILDSSATLTALVNDVLDLSKIEAGKFEIVRAEHDVGEFLRRQSRLWMPRAREKGLELRLSTDSSLPDRLAFDGVRVQQCLNNLISNAVKFTSEGGVTLNIESSPQADGDQLVTIKVKDTGSGLDEATLSRLFQPFTQADALVAGKHGGTGLGLSITRKLAELMGGAAGASSEKGKGSEFFFSFVASPPGDVRAPGPGDEAAAASPEEEAKADSGGLRVLVVDDNAMNRKVAVLLLKPLNAETVQAANGLEALEAMQAERFDAVLLDMHMPVLDGVDTIARIRASGEDWSKTPVIAVTADASFGEAKRFVTLGLDGYLPKPLDAGELQAAVRHVTDPAAAEELRAAG